VGQAGLLIVIATATVGGGRGARLEDRCLGGWRRSRAGGKVGCRDGCCWTEKWLLRACWEGFKGSSPDGVDRSYFVLFRRNALPISL